MCTFAKNFKIQGYYMEGKYIAGYFAIQVGSCIEVYEGEDCVGHICSIVGDLSQMSDDEFEQEVNDELDIPVISKKHKSISPAEKDFIENV